MKLSKYGFNVALVLLLVPGIARAENPDLMTLIGASNAGIYRTARDNSGIDQYDNASTYGLSSSDHNSFVVDYGNSGVVRGHGRCSTRAGTNPWINGTYETISGNFVETLTDETGQSGAQYCYCGLDSYTPLNGGGQSLSGPWVFNDDYGDADFCADICSWGCASILVNDNENSLMFRAAMFNAYAPPFNGISSVTTQTYVDNALNGKQAKITTTGTNKLMTYGASTGATPGSRDIVSTLGTSTTATTVPEVGPIVTGLNGKQNTVNGTANYVMTGTGTAGTLGEKPVYSATINYTNALVTAQTINTAAATAANSELSCIDNDCLLWQINTSGPTTMQTRVDLNQIDLSTLINVAGVKYCFKRLSNGNASYSGICQVTNYSDWGVTFNLDGIETKMSGISACSILRGSNAGEIAYDQEQVQADYESNLAAAPTSNSQRGKYCYCKLTDPSNTTTGWVFSDYNASECAYYCAYKCANSVKGVYNSNPVKETLFGG